jgi:hypothetical protein
MDNLITIGQYIQVEIIENVFYLINVFIHTYRAGNTKLCNYIDMTNL